MNEKLHELVEKLFAECEQNEEVCAARDEVMDNCTEHYDDLKSNGLSDDEALEAIVESLRGMEEVAKSYPRRDEKKLEPDAEPASDPFAKKAEPDQPETVRSFTFAADEVKELDINAIVNEVTFRPSGDDCFHISFSREETAKNCEVTCTDGKLTIRVLKVKPEGNSFTGFSPKFDSAESFASSIGSFMQQIGSFVQGAIKQVGNAMASGEITILVPGRAVPAVKAVTTSGDLSASDLSLAKLELHTVSGDVNVNHLYVVEDAVLTSTSGDVNGWIRGSRSVSATSVSGDITLQASAEREVTVRTTSGDIDLVPVCHACALNTVSGDIDVRVTDLQLHRITTNTVSGDQRITLPAMMDADVRVSGRGNQVHNRRGVKSAGNTVLIEVKTISGEVEII